MSSPEPGEWVRVRSPHCEKIFDPSGNVVWCVTYNLEEAENKNPDSEESETGASVDSEVVWGAVKQAMWEAFLNGKCAGQHGPVNDNMDEILKKHLDKITAEDDPQKGSLTSQMDLWDLYEES